MLFQIEYSLLTCEGEGYNFKLWKGLKQNISNRLLKFSISCGMDIYKTGLLKSEMDKSGSNKYS